MIKDYKGRKFTPNQFAKQMVVQHGEHAFYWFERVDTDDMTVKEKDAIADAVSKQFWRVARFLLNGEPIRSFE
jgi:hypothetical protein